MKLRPRLALITVAVCAPIILALVWWDARSQQRAAAAELLEHARGLAEWPGWVARCEASPATWQGGGPQQGGPGPGGPGGNGGPGPGGNGGPGPEAEGRPPPPRGSDEVSRPPGGQPPPRPQRGDELERPPGGQRPPPPGGPPPGGDRGDRGDRGELRFPRHRQPAQFFAYGAELTSPNPAAPALPEELRAEMADRDALWVPTPWSSSVVRVLVRVPASSTAASSSGSSCAFVLAQGTTEPWLGGVLPPTHLWLLPLLAVLGVMLLAVGPVVRRIQQLTAAAHRSEQSGYASGVELQDGDGGRDELAELARSLDGAASRVRGQLAETHRREQALREYVANTTHDIMIPLTVLQGHLAELTRGGGELPPPQVLGAAMDEAHYLGALIHNLAMAAKLDVAAAEPLRAPVDLCALVERVVMRHRAIARSLEVALDHAVPATPILTDGDVTMLEQAVTNLTYNAIRHNQRGGHVAIVLERTERVERVERVAHAERVERAGDSAGFSLRVIDDGPGVLVEELPRLSERGFRGDAARTRNPEGRGLGLDIARRVAELHGLALRFSRPQEGGLQAELAVRSPDEAAVRPADEAAVRPADEP